MARTKAEGFTRLRQDLFEWLILAPLSLGELKVLLWLVRQTVGFDNRATAYISLTRFEKGTGQTRPTVIKAVRHLQEKGIITSGMDGRRRWFAIEDLSTLRGLNLVGGKRPLPVGSEAPLPVGDRDNGHRRNTVTSVTQQLRPGGRTVQPYSPVRTCTVSGASRDMSRDITSERSATVTLRNDGKGPLPDQLSGFTSNSKRSIRATTAIKERERNSVKKVGGMSTKSPSPLAPPAAAGKEKDIGFRSQGGLRPPFGQAPLRKTLKVGVSSHA